MNSVSPQPSIANEYLALASTIVRDPLSTDGALRSAISRAYYAVWTTAREQLLGCDGLDMNRYQKKLRQRYKKKYRKQPGSHEWVIFAVTEVTATSAIKSLVLSQQVEQLREARVHADYHFDPRNLSAIPAATWRKYAEDNLLLASQILPLVRRLPHY